MSILDDTKEITEEYLEENGWEKICYEEDYQHPIYERNVECLWLYVLNARISPNHRELSFYIIYEPSHKEVCSVSTIHSHLTTIDDISDMNVFMQNMVNVWIPQYYKMFEENGEHF